MIGTNEPGHTGTNGTNGTMNPLQHRDKRDMCLRHVPDVPVEGLSRLGTAGGEA
jgi:hypothetical protein